DAEDAVIVELRLGQRLTAESKLDNGHGVRTETQNPRRIDSGRHPEADAVHGGVDLGHRGVDTHLRVKIDLDRRDPGEGLRFNGANVVDGGEHELAERGDALLHLRRREALIRPYDADDGDVDSRKDVRGCGLN